MPASSALGDLAAPKSAKNPGMWLLNIYNLAILPPLFFWFKDISYNSISGRKPGLERSKHI
jgi:hypothetical protein